MIPRERLQVTAIGILFVIILIFASTRFSNVLLGPKVVIDSPLDGSVVHEASLAVTGHAYRISQISLNDRRIYTDNTGLFSETLLLPKGYTILVVKARDQFGRYVEKRIRLFYQE